MKTGSNQDVEEHFEETRAGNHVEFIISGLDSRCLDLTPMDIWYTLNSHTLKINKYNFRDTISTFVV